MINNGRPWRQILAERLPVYGHRNWIVVADSAYPAHSAPGIETIVAAEELSVVLPSVLAEIDASTHITPAIFIDMELAFIAEQDAPGASELRDLINSHLGLRSVRPLPHEEIIAMLDRAAQAFRVLILKTTTVIPYSTVFLELGCGYWQGSAEQRLRDSMAAA